MRPLCLLLAVLFAWPLAAQSVVRVATYNVGLGRDGPGLLLKDIEDADDDILAIAEIITTISPDILLLTGFDNDYRTLALTRFNAIEGLKYPYFFAPLGNAGLDSGQDLNGNGRLRDWNDAWGFGRFEGSESMALLSRYPIQTARSFDTLLWKAYGPPPRAPDNTNYFAHWDQLRLAAHSIWDVEVSLPNGPLHILAAHPTPPVFDGEEDANGLRNEAEINFLNRYLSFESTMDDSGIQAPINAAPVILLADLNADPIRGESLKPALLNLLSHPRLQQMPAQNTVEWAQTGRLQVDYVLPSKALTVVGTGVFWPENAALLEAAKTRHRLIWVDIAVPG
jgi:hypothetical protein